jgi:DNA-binding NtrC family response regulator
MTLATHSNDRPTASVLVVEDDPGVRAILTRFLADRGYGVRSAEHGLEALDVLATHPVDLVLSDVHMPQMSGIELLRVVRERDPDAQLVLITGHSSVRDAVEAIKLGAADYVEKPIDPLRLGRIVDTVLEKRDLRQRTRILEQRLQGTVAFRGMIARSQAMLETFTFIERLARYPTTVLITGESGTGKELVARALHDLSPFATARSSRATAPPSPRRSSKASSSATSAARSPAPTGTARGCSSPPKAAPSSWTRSASCPWGRK